MFIFVYVYIFPTFLVTIFFHDSKEKIWIQKFDLCTMIITIYKQQ